MTHTPTTRTTVAHSHCGWRALYVQARKQLRSTRRELFVAKTMWDVNAHLEHEARDFLNMAMLEVSATRELLDRETAKNDELRQDAARLRTRVEARFSLAIDRGAPDGDYTRAQCTECGAEAGTPEAIRHVAGTRIGERACPVLLDARALGLPVTDDSEEVRAHG